MTALISALSPTLIQALAAALVGGICYGIHYATGLLKAKTTDTKVGTAIDLLENLADTVVQSLEATMVPVLKEQAQGGKWDGKAVADAALAQLKALYGDQGLATLGKVLGLSQDALVALLTGKLEQANAAQSAPTAPAKLQEALDLAAQLHAAGIKADPKG